MSTKAPPRRRSGGCPVCARPASRSHLPFCSQGCRDRDLLNWLGEGYRVPGPPAEAPGEIGTDALDSEG